MERSEQPDGQHAQPRVVMLLANEFVHDTRVFKQARSLIEWGCAVHVVAVARPHLPEYELHHGIHVHRVPMGESGLRHVAAALCSWWSRRLLRGQLLKQSDTQVVVAPVEPVDGCDEPDECTADERVHRNGAVSTVVLSSNALNEPADEVDASAEERAPVGEEPATPMDEPLAGYWQTSRALPARGYRRVKVVSARWMRNINRATAQGMWRRARSRTLRLISRLRRSVSRMKRSISRMRRSISRMKRWYPPALRLLAVNHRLAAKALALEPDVLEAHDLNTLLGAMMVRRVRATPVVYDSHELYLERNIGDKSRFTDKLFWWPVERFGIVRCDVVLTVAAGICDHLANQYGIRRPALVRNVQPYEPPAPPSRLLSDELGIDRRRPIVLYPGAITINRGLEQMIDSSVHLRDAAYVVMGYARNPAYLESLKQRAEALGQLNRTVFFRDAVPIEDVVRYTASADLGIVPTQNVCLSYQFESSNKIFHCLMAGVPLVMSDHSEKRHIAERYDVALLFDETSPQAIADAVNSALSDGERYAAMRRNCLDAARELNWEHEEHTLRNAFAAVLGDRARPVPEPHIPEPTRADIEVLPTHATPSVNVNEYTT